MANRKTGYIIKNIIKLSSSVPFNTAADLDSDHDYETIDSSFATIVKEAQENVLFY